MDEISRVVTMVREGVVEFHGFRDNNGEFIIKELALVGDDKRYTHVFFKPPFFKFELDVHYHRMANWLERNLHHIKWDYGDLTYSEETMKTFCNYYDKIYTKGVEKTKFLQRFHHNVIQLPDDESMPKEKFGTQVKCPVHVERGPCALHRAVILMDWLKLQRNYVREADRLESFDLSTIPSDKRSKMAKEGFYYDRNKDKVICFWCNDFYDWHIACVNYYVNNVPMEFDIIVPRI